MNRVTVYHRILSILLSAAIGGLSVSARDQPSDQLFEKQVAPILRLHCIGCHDDEQIKGDLSLQSKSGARLDEIIDADSPGDSILLELITPNQSGRAEMPKDRAPLSDSEISTIKDWIQRGAPWPDDLKIAKKNMNRQWWSLQPIQHVTPPVISKVDSRWARNEIDLFVLRRLNERSLTKSPPADRRTLIRRLYYDVIGLPPSREQIESFAQDPRPDAYERRVDDLLASPEYGQRWARHWLDLVHYGDTHGFDKDKLRPNAWPYRDWVIRSLNEDKNYTEFVRQQIAGDVLAPDDRQSIIATGMIVAGPFDWVGHIEVANGTLEKQRIRNVDRDDMTSTVMNTFVSTTVQCARCHDHKFDPVSQGDYYGLQSIFAAIDRADRLLPPPRAVQSQVNQLLDRQAEVKQQIELIDLDILAFIDPKLAPVKQEMREIEQALSVMPKPISTDPSDAQQSSNGYHSEFANNENVTKQISLRSDEVQMADYIVIHPARPVDFPDTPGFAFPVRWQVVLTGHGMPITKIADFSECDFPNPGDRPVVIKIDNDLPFQDVRITATKLSTRSPNDDKFAMAFSEVQIFSHGENIAVRFIAIPQGGSIDQGLWHANYINDNKSSRHKLLAGDAANAFVESLDRRAELLARQWELARKAVQIRAGVDDRLLKRREELTGELEEVNRRIQENNGDQYAFTAATHFRAEGNFVPTEGELREVYVLDRGNESTPLRELGLSMPSAMGVIDQLRWHFDQLPPDHSEGDRRLALANWITDPQNPLTWRSIVNRLWQHHFGRGIVTTPNDFGRMGAAPSHPELLDFLAAGFRDGGQSIKQMHRMILTSETYRQSSAHNTANAKLDADNQYLWRMNRRKLDAEQLRDSLLVVAGKLDRRMFGPGFMSFKVKDDHSPHYDYLNFDPDDPTTHRRSIFRFVVRSVPDPFFESFDCADPSQIVARRSETNTALQALAMLNNQFTVHMAEELAADIVRQSENTDQQVEIAVGRILGRTANEKERKILSDIASQHSLANVCRILMNSNEFMFVD